MIDKIISAVHYLFRRRPNEQPTRQQTIGRLCYDLRYMRTTRDNGLRLTRLSSMPHVKKVQVQMGWTNFIDVMMDNGYQFYVKDFYLEDAIRRAAVCAALHVKQVYLTEQDKETK